MKQAWCRLAAVIFLVWLALFALNVAWGRHQAARHRGTLIQAMERAGALLSGHCATSGAFPQTGGKWVAVPREALDITEPEVLAKELARAEIWEGLPRSAILYRSDGKDYKLVLHHPTDCAEVHALKPSLADPARTAYSRKMVPGGWTADTPDERFVASLKDPFLRQDPDLPAPLFGACWAWGVWTPGAVFW